MKFKSIPKYRHGDCLFAALKVLGFDRRDVLKRLTMLNSYQGKGGYIFEDIFHVFNVLHSTNYNPNHVDGKRDVLSFPTLEEVLEKGVKKSMLLICIVYEDCVEGHILSVIDDTVYDSGKPTPNKYRVIANLEVK